jgi:hypothetical protein
MLLLFKWLSWVVVAGVVAVAGLVVCCLVVWACCSEFVVLLLLFAGLGWLGAPLKKSVGQFDCWSWGLNPRCPEVRACAFPWRQNGDRRGEDQKARDQGFETFRRTPWKMEPKHGVFRLYFMI